MYPNEYLIEIHQTVLDHKRHLVVDHGEYDMLPLMALRWRDHVMCQVDLALCLAKLYEALEPLPAELIRTILEPSRIMGAILETIVSNQWPKFPALLGGRVGKMVAVPTEPLEGIWLSLEQFHDIRPYEAVKAMPDRGDLQRDFETNPDSPVLEAIATYVIETGATGLGEWARMTTTHRKVEGGGIEWLETEIRRSDVDPFVDPECDSLINVIVPYVTRESLA